MKKKRKIFDRILPGFLKPFLHPALAPAPIRKGQFSCNLQHRDIVN
jgi:hypothetical protein